MQSLEGESTEPRTLDRNVRHDMNLGLCEYPTAMMLTDVGEVSKEKRRDLKRSVWPFSITVPPLLRLSPPFNVIIECRINSIVLR